MTGPDAMRDSAAAPPPLPAAPANPTRPMYWSVRRELWENRSIVLAPLIAAGVVLFGYLISLRHLPEAMAAVGDLPPEKQLGALSIPYIGTIMVVLVTGIIVATFYSLDALYGERRDRSILFWKSLPVSDTTTVLSKAAIPLVVMPLFTFAVVIALQLLMLLLGSAVLAAHGMSAAPLWTGFPVLHVWLAQLYAVVAMALWHAPLYAWLFLVSGWARRSTFLWAMLTPLALCVVERIAFGTSYFAGLLKYRIGGWMGESFARGGHLMSFKEQGGDVATHLPEFAPLTFLTSAGLWLGLAAAALLFFAAIRQRRYREPI